MLLTVTLPSTAGDVTLDAAALFSEVKAAFLTDYADDPAVGLKITRNGDLAEREYTETVRAISPDLSRNVAPAAITAFIRNVARGALVNLAIGYRRNK